VCVGELLIKTTTVARYSDLLSLNKFRCANPHSPTTTYTFMTTCATGHCHYFHSSTKVLMNQTNSEASRNSSVTGIPLRTHWM
jgi:hypothetical protein